VFNAGHMMICVISMSGWLCKHSGSQWEWKATSWADCTASRSKESASVE